jgi:hypothetical protein
MKNYIYGGIVLLLLILLYRAECGSPVIPVGTKKVVVDGKKYEVINEITDTQYVKYTEKGETDTVVHDTTIYVNVPVLDSAKMDSLVRLYYAKNVHSDTITLQYGSVYVQDSVQFNKIFGRKWSADLLIPKESKTTIVKEPAKSHVYLGAGASYGTSVAPTVGLMLKTKQERIYGVSLGVSNGLPVYGGFIYIKLF